MSTIAGCWQCRLIYPTVFGGVISMPPDMFRKVNGYSLNFFGWGGEDDDMGDRYIRNHGCPTLLFVGPTG